MRLNKSKLQTKIQEVTDQSPSAWWDELPADQREQTQALWLIIRMLRDEQRLEISKRKGTFKINYGHHSLPSALKQIKLLLRRPKQKNRWAAN